MFSSCYLSALEPHSLHPLQELPGHLCYSLKKNAGRNNQGKITVRHQGGGVRRQYRIIDFKRNKDGIPATVIGIEYDPNRTANIALICYADGTKSYIIAPEGLTDGMKVMNGPEAEVRLGNCLPLSEIPVGTQVHNIELYPGKGGQLVRSAGNSAQLMAKEGKYATLRLPSGEMRMVPLVCRATVGIVGNVDHSLIKIGKAGRKRHMGIRPTVKLSSAKGPFFSDLAICLSSYYKFRYLIALPSRLLTISLSDAFFLRVFRPRAGLPQGVLGPGRPIPFLPSPPP